MNLRYRVHSAAWSPIAVEAALPDGGKVEATVQALVVELVPEGHPGGSVTVRLPNPSDEVKALFAPDRLLATSYIAVEA